MSRYLSAQSESPALPFLCRCLQSRGQDTETRTELARTDYADN